MSADLTREDFRRWGREGGLTGRLGLIGIKRYVKIKADANPYLPEYAGYFWRRRHDKQSRLLPAMSAREYRASARPVR